MHSLTEPETWIALLTLTALEIVLGIDNIIFLSILASRLPPDQARRARTLGLTLAMCMRLLLLLSLNWIMRLRAPLFAVLGHDLSGRDLILLGGGLFLLAKSTCELHDKLEGVPGRASRRVRPTMASVLLQIVLLDIVFSLDSVITAVGMANQLGVMVAAVLLSVGVMLASAGAIGAFVERHPTVKVLALSFLLLIGVSLIAEGLERPIAKGYIYFAMGFSVFVEMINLRIRARAPQPVVLRQSYEPLPQEPEREA
ncbi:MAG: TerC family protein [Myxococcales bacterium]|nr:TerC family protein [Myxococcota bacterium]MDW8280321.1 TerC family protein [Myxococcales bacterium]